MWDSLSNGDLSAVEAALSPQARWRAVEDGPWNCESRAEILDVLGRNLQNGLSGRIEEAFDVERRTVVAFRPDTPNSEGWPLDDGVRYLVLSRGEDGLITEMKGCLDRVGAVAYAERDSA
ncbi:MAG: hypothetical protein ACYCSI_04940 [Solirubrobacteraceae bacterium]